MARRRILVVEDDESIQRLYESFFGVHDKEFFWVLAQTGEHALKVLGKHPLPPVDAVLLDWGLPGADGLKVLHWIRSNPAAWAIPVFMVTASASEKDLDLAFEAGVDDYLTKPFREKELLGRLRALLRRADLALERHRVYRLDDLDLDIHSRRVTVAGEEVKLHPKEYDLLKLFIAREDVLHSLEYLWDAVWGYESDTYKDVLKTTISNLRKKLGPKWGPRLEARESQGYIFYPRLVVSHR